ncbi:MAG: DUF4065 domain-containing protein [Snodgrassella sp.]|nr:DUF4065 domain-containing protein [Snodgrassella sp.]
MAYAAIPVANSIIDLAKQGKICDLSPMKLQKLMYFTQFFYLKNFNNILITDYFVRWKFGPVIPSIYYQLKSYGANPIDNYIRQLSPENDVIIYMMAYNDLESWAVLNKVVEELGGLSAIQLSALTHRENSSWGKKELGTVITPDDMKNSEI